MVDDRVFDKCAWQLIPFITVIFFAGSGRRPFKPKKIFLDFIPNLGFVTSDQECSPYAARMTPVMLEFFPHG
jgi:hypothetical protein